MKRAPRLRCSPELQINRLDFLDEAALVAAQEPRDHAEDRITEAADVQDVGPLLPA
jgi:hypothetical protein